MTQINTSFLTGVTGAAAVGGTALANLPLDQKVSLIMEALAVVNAIIPEIQSIVEEAKSKDTLLVKLETIVKDLEQSPANLIAEVKKLISVFRGGA